MVRRWRCGVTVAALLVAAAGCGGHSAASDGGADGPVGTDSSTSHGDDADAPPSDAAGAAPEVAPDAPAGGTGGTGGSDGGSSSDAHLDRVPRPDSLDFDGRIDGEQTFCNMLENTAPTIAPTLRGTSTAPPELHGGPIPDGRYELVAVDEFSDVRLRAAVPSLYRRTIEFRGAGAEWQLVEVARDDVLETSWSVVRRAYDVTTTGNMLKAAFAPCTGAVDASTPYNYEATNDEVVMYIVTTRLLLTYLRVP